VHAVFRAQGAGRHTEFLKSVREGERQVQV
jgi:hypothetical protein